MTTIATVDVPCSTAATSTHSTPSSSSSSSVYQWPYLNIPINDLRHRWVGIDGEWLPPPQLMLMPKGHMASVPSPPPEISPSAMKLFGHIINAHDDYDDELFTKAICTISEQLQQHQNATATTDEQQQQHVNPMTSSSPSSSTSSWPWRTTHRQLPSSALLQSILSDEATRAPALLSIADAITALENVPMIDALDDNAAVAYTVNIPRYYNRLKVNWLTLLDHIYCDH
jgi:hypothetical protein